MSIAAILGGGSMICAAIFVLYLSQTRPLHPWGRNYFNKLMGLPDIVDRILLIIVGIGFLLIGIISLMQAILALIR
jgi:hypothetical protein